MQVRLLENVLTNHSANTRERVIKNLNQFTRSQEVTVFVKDICLGIYLSGRQHIQLCMQQADNMPDDAFMPSYKSKAQAVNHTLSSQLLQPLCNSYTCKHKEKENLTEKEENL